MQKPYLKLNNIFDKFVPTTIILHSNATIWDLDASKEFTMGAKHANFPHPEIYDDIGHMQDITEFQSGNYGGLGTWPVTARQHMHTRE